MELYESPKSESTNNKETIRPAIVGGYSEVLLLAGISMAPAVARNASVAWPSIVGCSCCFWRHFGVLFMSLCISILLAF